MTGEINFPSHSVKRKTTMKMTKTEKFIENFVFAERQEVKWNPFSPYVGWHPFLSPEKQNWSLGNLKNLNGQQRSLYPHGRYWEDRGYSEHFSEPRVYLTSGTRFEDGIPIEEYERRIKSKAVPKNEMNIQNKPKIVKKDIWSTKPNDEIQEGIETSD
jgi:hypothetical protein